MLVDDGAMDMTEITHSYNVYKMGKHLPKTIDNIAEDDSEKMEKETDKPYSNLIGYCVLKLKLLLEKECVDWAREFDDHMLRKAVFIAG